MMLLAGAVVWAFVLFLVGLAGTIYARPALARRFLGAFARTARAHYVEQGLRLVVGIALVVYAPAMAHPAVFQLFGGLVVGTTVGLLVIPWRWHQRFARWVVPPVLRHLKLYGVGVVLLAVVLLYGVVAGTGVG